MMSPDEVILPPSDATVGVQIIRSFEQVTCQADVFFTPAPGSTSAEDTPMVCAGKAFVLDHAPSRRRVLFDLGIRKQATPTAPFLARTFEYFKVKLGPDVAETMRSEGLDPASVDVMIWSHSHWDHTGLPDNFPNATLVVGPGTQAAVRPGWPNNEDAHVFESDFENRKVQEIVFSKDTSCIAGLPAHDFFGDGSFYLLDAPGHCAGHIVGLARTTASPQSFVLLGGDAAHHIGLLRPSMYMPLPEALGPKLPSCLKDCARDAPFLGAARGAYPDEDATRRTHAALQALDAREDVLLLMAHDDSLDAQITWFPSEANGWKDAGWKERSRWAFLEAGNPCNRWSAPV